MKPLQIGFVGAGKITRIHHLPAIDALNPHAVSKAIFDTSLASAQALRKEGAPQAVVYDSLEDFIKSGVHAAIVSTPNHTHYPLGIALLQAGIHVLMEKPMAVSLSQADEMIAAAKEKGVVLQVNQTLRFTPAYAWIKDLIETGTIGEPLHIRCIRAASTSPDKGWSPGAKWFLSKAAHGGVVMDIAVHMADLLQWYFGPVHRIAAFGQSRIAEGDVTDHASSLFEFRSGATGTLELSWNFPRNTALLEIYGSKGVIRWDFQSHSPEVAIGDAPFTPAPMGDWYWPNAHESFLSAISGERPTPVPGEVGRNALALCLAIEEASALRREVFPDMLPL